MVATGLFGYGSHGRDIEEIWRRTFRESLAGQAEPPLRIFDENESLGYPAYPTEPCYVGINDPDQRRDAVERLGITAPPALLDPSSIVGWDCGLGRGVIIAPNAVLLREVRLGLHVHVNYMASMTRCRIGDYSTVCPAATICGDVRIGEGVLIGCGAVVKNLVKIGDGARVGAGAIVVKDVRPGETVVGVPAHRAQPRFEVGV